MANNVNQKGKPRQPESQEGIPLCPVALFMDGQPGTYPGTIKETGQSIRFPMVLVSLSINDQIKELAIPMPDAHRLACHLLGSMAFHGVPWAQAMCEASQDINEALTSDDDEHKGEETS